MERDFFIEEHFGGVAAIDVPVFQGFDLGIDRVVGGELAEGLVGCLRITHNPDVGVAGLMQHLLRV